MKASRGVGRTWLPGARRASGGRALVAAVLTVSLAPVSGGGRTEMEQQTRAARMRVEVVASYPHDRGAFTQGLVLENGRLYESTGLVGRSSLREVELTTGRVIRRVDVPPPLFAEGLAALDGRLVQLTWQNGRALVYDTRTFARVGEFAYRGEGWGLCHDGQELVMSDGSATLTFRRPGDFSIVRTLEVTMDGQPLDQLNELECVDGDVYANVWMEEFIVRIDGRTGRVKERIDASNLLSPLERHGVDVMNGIAYDPDDGTFLVTGKLWPRVFRVRVVKSGAGW